MRDLYEILGVTKKATKPEIKKSYRKLAMQYHPDRNPGDEEASNKFKEACAAWEILGDDNKREQYDTYGITDEPSGHGFSDAIFEAIKKALKIHPFQYYQYNETPFEENTGFGVPQGSRESVYYLFVAKRDEEKALQTIQEIFGIDDKKRTSKQIGLVHKDVDFGGMPFVAIGLNNVSKRSMSFDTVVRFDDACALPRLGTTSGQRDSFLDSYLENSRIIEEAQKVDEISRCHAYRFHQAIRAFIRNNIISQFSYPVVEYDNENNILIGNLDDDRAVKEKLIDHLRTAGFRADVDFSLQKDQTYNAKKSSQMLVIDKRRLEEHPQLADAFFDLIANPQRVSTRLPLAESPKQITSYTAL